VDDRGDPGLDPAVIAIDRLMAAYFGVGKIPGFLLGGEQPDVVVKRALIAFEREDIV